MGTFLALFGHFLATFWPLFGYYLASICPFYCHFWATFLLLFNTPTDHVVRPNSTKNWSYSETFVLKRDKIDQKKYLCGSKMDQNTTKMLPIWTLILKMPSTITSRDFWLCCPKLSTRAQLQFLWPRFYSSQNLFVFIIGDAFQHLSRRKLKLTLMDLKNVLISN